MPSIQAVRFFAQVQPTRPRIFALTADHTVHAVATLPAGGDADGVAQALNAALEDSSPTARTGAVAAALARFDKSTRDGILDTLPRSVRLPEEVPAFQELWEVQWYVNPGVDAVITPRQAGRLWLAANELAAAADHDVRARGEQSVTAGDPSWEFFHTLPEITWRQTQQWRRFFTDALREPIYAMISGELPTLHTLADSLAWSRIVDAAEHLTLAYEDAEWLDLLPAYATDDDWGTVLGEAVSLPHQADMLMVLFDADPELGQLSMHNWFRKADRSDNRAPAPTPGSRPDNDLILELGLLLHVAPQVLRRATTPQDADAIVAAATEFSRITGRRVISTVEQDQSGLLVTTQLVGATACATR